MSESSKPAGAVVSSHPRSPVRGWTKLVLQPVLFLAAGALLIAILGAAQRFGWISAGRGTGGEQLASVNQDLQYICPMMCTPPQSEAGRCPVCAMELVPAPSDSGNADGHSIRVDPVARRVANIRTAPVKAVPLTRMIRAIGELSYDEGSLKTISAYVDGRLDRLYADYTGVVVEEGDHLALLYSPQLYSSQVELLVAKRSRSSSRSLTNRSAIQPGRDLYDSARERLIEFGMTEPQLQQLEQSGEPTSRLQLCAPISGTVIEKHAVEGEYVKTGQPIYRLADLSTVWLMLELFPEDAAAVRYGHKVAAEVQSLPGREFTGRVAFIDPMVDRKTRTVGVRVVIPNDDGVLRVGDYAKATLSVALAATGERRSEIYDPELADKWISPRHPHVIESSPGNCRVCGVPLVPAARFGFTSQPTDGGLALVVPRNAVLMAGASSVVYVETEPGRFEIRPVVLGPSSGEEIAILQGVSEGEQVACAGNFLIDSQMQLAGNPSLIDPTRAQPGTELEETPSAEIVAALSGLSAGDRTMAKRQRLCPVTKLPLGSMGAPPKVEVEGRTVFICCEGCRELLLEQPEKYLAELAAGSLEDDSKNVATQMDLPPMGELQMMEPQLKVPEMVQPQAGGDEAAAAAEALAGLSMEDRALAERQQLCPVTDMPLGSMGIPIKVDVKGRPVMICCEGCRESLLAEPAKYLTKLPEEIAQ